MKTSEVPSCKCLACGTQFDRATDPAANRTPNPGDVTVCLECGHLMAFNHDLTVRELTGEEMISIAGDKMLLAFQKARGLARKKP